MKRVCGILGVVDCATALPGKEGVSLEWKHNRLRNDRELVKPSEALKWFALEPETLANVISMPKAATGA